MLKLLVNTRRPDITFHCNGRIHITARVTRMLSIRPGDTINIAHDNGEFLLFATHHSGSGRHAAQCYPTKKGSQNYCANSVTLCKMMMTIANVTSGRAAFMVGEKVYDNYIIYLPIITSRPL